MLSLSFSGTAGGTTPAYPNRSERNPKKKTPAFIAQWGRAFVHEVLRDGTFQHWHHARALNDTRLAYLLGKQDAKMYDRFVEPMNSENDPTGIARRIDRRILPLVPKHVRILSDKLSEQEFAPTVTVIDELGEHEKEAHLEQIRTQMRHGDWAAENGLQPPPGMPANMPRDEEDLQLYATSEYQHEEAMHLEQKLALSLAEGNWKQLDRDVVLHFYAFGEACGYVATGPSGRPLPCLLLPGRVLLLASAHEDYRDMRAGAHLEHLTLGQLRAEAGEQFKKEEWDEIERNATSRTGTSWDLPQGLGNPQDSGMVQVVRFSFLSEDDLVYKTATNRLGNEYTRRKSVDYKNTSGTGKVTRATATNVYEGTLIVGTDLSYNCRLAVGQLRDMDNPLLGLLPYRPMTPGLLAGHSACPMDEVMGISDFCQEQWLRLQEACLRAVPQGYNFDPEVMIESISMLKGQGLGADGLLDIKPTLTQFYRDGNTVSKRKAKDGSLLPPMVTKNDTGVPTDVLQYWQNLRAGMQMLESIMGSNAVVSAATPDPEAGKGQSELAVAGTLSSLGGLAHGKTAMFEGMCRAMGLRIWLQEKRQPVTGTLPGKPGQPPTAVKARPGIGKRRFAFRIEKLPTKQDWADFYAIAKVSLQAEQITLADYAYLVEIDNLKLARRLLAQRAKRIIEQKMQELQQNQQATIQGQVTSAQEAEKAKQGTIQLQHQLDMQKESAITERAYGVARIYADGQHRTEQQRGQHQQEKIETQETGAALRQALGHEAEQQGAAQQANAAGFADLAPAA